MSCASRVTTACRAVCSGCRCLEEFQRSASIPKLFVDQSVRNLGAYARATPGADADVQHVGYRPVTGGSIDDLLNADEDTEIVEMTTWATATIHKHLNNQEKNYGQSNFVANVYGEYRFGKYLKLRVTGGINRKSQRPFACAGGFFNSSTPSHKKIAGVIKGVGQLRAV